MTNPASQSAGLILPPHPKRQEFVARLLKNDALWLGLQGRELISRPPGNDALCSAVMIDLYQQKAMRELAAFVRQFHAFMPAASRALLKKFAQMMGAEGYFIEALALLEAALRYEADKAQIHFFMAVGLMQLGRRDEAKQQLARALAATPGHAEAEFLLAQLQMMESGFTQGLDAYESRLRVPNAPRPGNLAKRWRGEPVEGKRVRLWGEQGIGDIIMFAGFIPWLLAQSPAMLTLCVPRKMVSLFSRSFPAARIEPLEAHAFMNAADSADYDAEAPMGDVLRYAMPHYVPAEHAPYLKADTAVAAALRQKLLPAGATRLVGFSWRTTNSSNGAVRNIPLEQWAPVFSVPGCAFIALQHGAGAMEEAQHFAKTKGYAISPAGFDPVKDTDQLASAIAAMDEVISADNANIHLAGALGVHATAMLNAASDFRWLLGRTDSLWYKSLSLERQEKPMQWQKVIARVADGLLKRMA